MDEDEYTNSPADLLTFSTDTVAFDTIISGTPTNTYTFTVYNHASRAIRLASVSLGLGEASPFKVNVDGTALSNGTATDFEIAARDSMIVYLMANVPTIDSDDPQPVSDKLTFVTEGGASQDVVLEAAGQAVTTLAGLRVTRDSALTLKRPYRVMDSLVVEQGATLTLTAGTRLYFHPGSELIVHGTLVSQGTLEAPVELRGDRLGYMFAGQPYDRIPGQWGGVRFTTTSYGNQLDYTDIHSGVYGLRADSGNVEELKLTLNNSVVHNTTGHALDLRLCRAIIGNSQLTNTGGDCAHIRGGDVTMIHCTLGRFYVFTGGYGHALDFANYDGEVSLPLTNLQLVNSIVTGYQSDELMGSQNEKRPNDAFSYSFSHCLLNTPKPAEDLVDHFTSCLFEADAPDDEEGHKVERERNFTPLPDLKTLQFSFELSPLSLAVGTADPAVTSTTYPTDRLGRPRGDKPDMGCYQHQDAPTDGNN